MVIKKTNIIHLFIFLLAAIHFYSCQKEVFVENKEGAATDVCRVAVNSNPQGAKIYVDDKFSGFSTPDTINWLSSSQHRITLKFTLIQDTSIYLRPVMTGINSVFVDYFASPRNYGSIICASIPTSASIFLNGTKLDKTTPYTIPYLFPAVYNVKYKYPGYRDDSTNVTVYGGRPTYNLSMMQDTTVWVDYQLLNSNIPSNKIIAMDIDRNNNVWVATLDNGIARFTKGKFTHFNTSNSGIPYNFVTCIKVDPDNNIWIGTIMGLAKYNGAVWTVYKAGTSNLPDNYITSIHSTPDGNTWIGTAKGLARISGSTIYSYSSSVSPLLQNFVSGITSDISGRLWVSSIGGISRLSNGIWNIYTRDSDGLVGYDCGVITSDKTGNVWCAFPENPKSGIAGGLMKFDGTNWREFAVPQIPKGRIQSLFVDSYNNKWIGSSNGFLLVKTDNSQTVYRSREYAMLTYDVRDIKTDSENNAWIALFGGGILKWKKPYN